jgi:hypothetical protein
VLWLLGHIAASSTMRKPTLTPATSRSCLGLTVAASMRSTLTISVPDFLVGRVRRPAVLVRGAATHPKPAIVCPVRLLGVLRRQQRWPLAQRPEQAGAGLRVGGPDVVAGEPVCSVAALVG